MLIGSAGLTVLTGRRRLIADKRPVAKLGLSALIVVNTTLVINPLASRVTAIANLAAEQGALPDSYAPLKKLEDRYRPAACL